MLRSDMDLWSHLKAEMLTSPAAAAVPGLVKSVILQKVPEEQFLVLLSSLKPL